MTSTPDLLRAWDRGNYVPSGTGITMSRLGGCRRQAGYLHAQTPPSDPEREEDNDGGQSLEHIVGSAVHKVIEEAARTGAQLGDLVEQRVEVAGVFGKFDRYEADTRTVVDVKTVYNRIPKVRAYGPKRQELWQVTGNAAGLILTGVPVERVRIDYLDRASGELYSWSAPLNPAVLREALAWVEEVRGADVEWLPRDHNAASAMCRRCPFRSLCWGGALPGRRPESVLFVEDPDARRWTEEFLAAKAEREDAQAREDRAKFALDALRQEEGRSHTVEAPGGVSIRYKFFRGRETAQADVVKAYYAAHGDPHPYERGEPYWVVSAALDAEPSTG